MKQDANGATAGLTGITLVAFAANSLLCRAALNRGAADAATFTFLRIASGAGVLGALLLLRDRAPPRWRGSWASSLALLAYAALFSFAYRLVPAGVGALVLFASVQLTMIGAALRAGRGPRGRQWGGVLLAFGGLVLLTSPGSGDLGHPAGVVLMAGSGIAWGVYSLYGTRATDPTAETAGNFVRAVLPAALLLAGASLTTDLALDTDGVVLAVLSGAVASGLGYVLWYAVVPRLGSLRAAVVQLAVPVIAALGGIAFLHETLTPRLVAAGAAILGGVFLVMRPARGTAPAVQERAPS